MIAQNERIDLLDRLGQYMLSGNEAFEEAKLLAERKNGWFDQDNIQLAVDNIARQFLQKEKLEQWAANYKKPEAPKNVGIVMAGNIPLVGFHDFLSVFMSGHRAIMKLSTKDDVLLPHLVNKLTEWQPELKNELEIADQLKNCDAYIATGSNNTARYFEQYFSKYPNIIRKNRTSVAILQGNEAENDYEQLGKDIFSYYGLGCRNVSKVYLPKGYDPQKLLDNIDQYKDVIHHNKYKNNFDYHLAIYLLNKVPYRTNDFLLMVENEVPFSPVGTLHYEYYNDFDELTQNLQSDDNIQCIVDNSNVSFGNSQVPALEDYADNADTMMFLSNLC